MADDETVPMYTQEGSLEDDLRRIAEASSTTHITPLAPPPPTIAPIVNSGDPDTDLLIQRLLREDAEEEGGSQGAVPEYGPPANVVQTFFDCIKNENSELISALIDGGFVKVNTKDQDGVTPLVAAVRANHVRTVQQLVDYGANVDEMSNERDRNVPYWPEYRHGIPISNPYARLKRTPLMVAAENGHLPLVKLFMDVFHAKDDIVPPDGMTALRLAAKNGHREVVDFLPSRRLGGMQRWKYKNKGSIRRGKILLIEIYRFFRIALFDIPKFFVWSIPKHVVVLPVRDSSVYLWKHKMDIARGVKNGFIKTGKGIGKISKDAAVGTIKGIKAIPGVTIRAAKATGRGIVTGTKAAGRGIVTGTKAAGKGIVTGVKATGRGIVTGSKATWKFLISDFPKFLVRFIKGTIKFLKAAAIWIKDAAVGTAKALKDFTVWMVKKLWKFLTVTIPKLIKITAKWIWTSLKYCGTKLADLVLLIISAIHTLVSKLVNWVSGITWKDVMNGFLNVLKFLFVEIPLMIALGIEHTGKFIKKVLTTLFGWFGKAIWYTGLGLLWLVTYVPMRIFELFVELFKAIGRGFHEIAVWINPKTI
ncbi:hypothetical protein ABW20_dc0107190 [Dactylellina cionopaga]|nr:hypothetical protein ABW20_dc0107190 [Dactylellina cionopaga]